MLGYRAEIQPSLGWQSFLGLRAVILLGGAVRRNPLSSATGRSLVDLPVDNRWSLLHQWEVQTRELAYAADLTDLTVRLILDGSAPEPVLPDVSGGITLRAERDPRPYRGTAGVLRDVTHGYEEDDFVLVANAAQVLLQPLSGLVSSMASTGSDICVVSHPDGTPSGMMLIRCACLRLIPKVGFVDMKEQGLPMIADRFKGSAVYRKLPFGLPVRCLEDYINALSKYHRQREDGQGEFDGSGGPLSEEWMPSFSIIEEGASVERGARLHDSVVLRGGRVERNAFVVRSIVCRRGVVSKSRTVVDELITT